MRSYEAARSLFSFLAFLAWFVVIIGALVALVGAGGGSRYGGAGAGLLAMAPGIAIGISGLILIAFVQMGRANVDTAEYTQQMLGISRDQLEVSRQSLKQGKSIQSSFFELNKEKPQTSEKASFSEQITKSKPTENLKSVSKYKRQPVQQYGASTTHRGHSITEFNGCFYVKGAEFDEIEHARNHIDTLLGKDGLNPPIATLDLNTAPEIVTQPKPVPEDMRAQIAALNAIPTPKPEPVLSKPEPAPKPVQVAANEPVQPPQKPVESAIEHNGKTIEPKGDKFIYNGIPFSSLEGAKRYVDNFNSAPPKTLPGVKRT